MKNDIPDLDNLITAIQCEGYFKNQCEKCPYNYQMLDDSGDNAFWWCDENKLWEHTLFYLKLYQHLIEEQKND